MLINVAYLVLAFHETGMPPWLLQSWATVGDMGERVGRVAILWRGLKLACRRLMKARLGGSSEALALLPPHPNTAVADLLSRRGTENSPLEELKSAGAPTPGRTELLR